MDVKIERALNLAMELGEMDAAKERLRGLRAERERLAAELSHVPVALPSVEELKPMLRERLRDLGATLKADVARGRLALPRLRRLLDRLRGGG